MDNVTRERPSSERSADVELLDVLALMWFGRYLIARFVIVFAVAGVLLALHLPNEYRSEAKYKPADSELNSLPGGLFSQVGALAGMNLDFGGLRSAALGIETLKSRPFLVDFARRQNLIVPLMASKGWDPVSGRLIIDPEIYDVRNERWLREPKASLPAAPSDDEIYGRFQDILSVERDVDTGFVTVSITFYSPVLARQWLAAMITDLNDQLRRREIAIRERSIDYLTEKLKENTISSLDGELGSLLKTEIRDHMLAEVREEYALETVARPYRPYLKAGPNRTLIAAVAVLLGGFAGMLFLLMRHARRPYVVQPGLLPFGALRPVFTGMRRRLRRS